MKDFKQNHKVGEVRIIFTVKLVIIKYLIHYAVNNSTSDIHDCIALILVWVSSKRKLKNLDYCCSTSRTGFCQTGGVHTMLAYFFVNCIFLGGSVISPVPMFCVLHIRAW